MKLFKTIVSFTLLIVSYPALAIESITDYVNQITVIHYAADRACIEIGSDTFKLDLSSTKGTAAYAMALAAYTSKAKLRATWQSTSLLEGGCNTGTTMYPLYTLETVDE